MPDVLLVIGPFPFYTTAPSFDKLKFEADFRWVQQERLSRDPAAQFLGPGVRRVDISDGGQRMYVPHTG